MNNNKLETQAKEILEIGEKIYKLQKVRNPHAILSDDENLLETEKTTRFREIFKSNKVKYKKQKIKVAKFLRK